MSNSGTMELIESLATLGFAGCAAGASGAWESKGADASRSSNAEDASFNFHLVTGFADGRRKRGGPNLNISYNVLDGGRQMRSSPIQSTHSYLAAALVNPCASSHQ